ncbi:MAG TPA: hypothetical protein VIG77_01340 [Ktedonobacterales bacterium]|jgi:hypothetical protein
MARNLSIAQQDDVTPRRPFRALPLIWVALLIFALCVVGVFIAAAPLRYLQLLRACAGPECAATSAYFVALDAFTALVWLALAATVFWRRPGDRMGIFTALTFLTFGVGRFPDTPLALTTLPGWWLPVEALRFLGSACLSIFVFIFPDGEFRPRITRLIAAGWIIIQIPEFFFAQSGASATSLAPLLQFAGFFGFVAVVVAAQTWRYRFVSTPRQRQQTRWVVLGVSLALLCYLALEFGYPLGVSLAGDSGPLGRIALTSLISLTFLLAPVSMAIAIARNRLYDVDVLINRALVYGALTATLAALYLIVILGLQVIVVAVNGSQQVTSLVLVCTTLGVAALFQPLRRALQRGIDRRFYRRKYDANATISAFSDSLRQSVDLVELRERLLEVVQETVQPSHTSLWLRTPPPPAR